MPNEVSLGFTHICVSECLPAPSLQVLGKLKLKSAVQNRAVSPWT